MQAGLQAVGDTYTRKALISPTEETVGKDGKRHRYPSKARQCEPPGTARSTSYYKRKEGENQRNLKMIDLRDKRYDRCAAMGVRQMVDYLKGEGYHVGKKLVRRLTALMGAESSISAQKLKQGRLGQVSYAIIDVSSRYIVGWGMLNTLDASNAIGVLNKAVARYGASEIINSGQGMQYTCKDWHCACDKYGIRISMDGRVRCLNNVWTERFWRTIKHEYVYLNPEPTVDELRRGIMQYLDYYNKRRCHQGLAHQTPRTVYAAVAA